MIPSHKYSYPYLRQLEFSSGAIHIACRCYSALSEGNLWQIQLNGNDLERDTRLNKRSNSLVAQPQPGIEPNQIFLEKTENVHLTSFNPKELKRWGEE